MKAFKKLTGIVAGILVVLILGANLSLLALHSDSHWGYRVEISRAALEIQEKGLDNLDLTAYPSLIQVTKGEGAEFLAGEEAEYAIREIDGQLYRFDYEIKDDRGPVFLILNISLVLGAVFLLCVLCLLQNKIIKPFETLKSLPEELARGNLTTPLQQQKNRYFGNFLCGMDLLREKLENQ